MSTCWVLYNATMDRYMHTELHDGIGWADEPEITWDDFIGAKVFGNDDIDVFFNIVNGIPNPTLSSSALRLFEFILEELSSVGRMYVVPMRRASVIGGGICDFVEAEELIVCGQKSFEY